MKRLLSPLLGLGLLLSGPAAAQEPVPAAEPLDPARLSQGEAASRLVGLPLRDGTGKALGRVDDAQLDAAQGGIAGLIVRVPEGVAAPASHLTIPWSDISLTQDAVRVNAPDEAGLAAYAPLSDRGAAGTPQPGDPMPEPGHGWTLSNLIGDYAVLRGGVGYGTVRDVVFDPADGKLIALVVDPAARFNTGQPAAYPFRSAAWTPQAGVYTLPYGEGEIADLPPFDYDSLLRQAD